MKITETLLRRKQACAGQLALFIETFPNGVDITEAICVSVADKFDWDWAATNLLSAPLLTEYVTKCESIHADYKTKCAPLLAYFYDNLSALRTDYERTALLADYEAKRAMREAV